MEKEIKRLLALLPTLNPISTDYTTVVNNLRTLTLTADLLDWKDSVESTEEASVPEPTPMAEPVSAPVVEAPIEEKPKEIKDPTKMTKEEVRALLSAASKAGIQIQPIIQKFVPEGKPIKFSEIPEDKYPELVEEIHNAR